MVPSPDTDTPGAMSPYALAYRHWAVFPLMASVKDCIRGKPWAARCALIIASVFLSASDCGCRGFFAFARASPTMLSYREPITGPPFLTGLGLLPNLPQDPLRGPLGGRLLGLDFGLLLEVVTKRRPRLHGRQPRSHRPIRLRY